MIYSTMLKSIFRTFYGDLPEPGQGPEELGLVLVTDGVGGFDLCGTALRYAVGAEKRPLQVKIVPWGHGWGRWHADLTNVANRDTQARVVAGEVAAFRARQAERAESVPVCLVAKSGGSGVAVKALELLPDDAVDVVVLLAPALSPRYDLTRALRAVRREMVVFWSPLDVFILGAGTRMFGTIDRVKTVSAGLVGFRLPVDLTDEQRDQYAKLRQVRWAPRMAATGYLGGHVGPDNPAFLRKYVLPLLRA